MSTISGAIGHIIGLNRPSGSTSHDAGLGLIETDFAEEGEASLENPARGSGEVLSVALVTLDRRRFKRSGE